MAKKIIFSIDFYLLFLITILSLLGLVFFYSTSYYESYKNFNDPNFLFLRFFFRITILGYIVFFIGFIFSFYLKKYKKVIFVIFLFLYLAIIFLILPFLKIDETGSSRWLRIGSISFQPSELIKPFSVLFLFFLMSNLKKNNLKNRIIIFFIFNIILLVPIFLQPALTNVLILSSMLFIAFISMLNSKKEVFITGIIFFIMILILIFLGTFWEYRKERIISFLTKGNVYEERYFQLNRSILGISSGGLLGKGLGKSESKILGLPQMTTDFIFAIYAEELGFIGSIFLFLLFFILIFRIIFIGLKSKEDWKKTFCFSLGWWLFIQTFIHLGSNVGLIAPTGVILPFLSYGPSGQLAIYFSLGLISRKEKKFL